MLSRFINGRAGLRLYLWAANREARWQRRNGYADEIFELGEGDGLYQTVIIVAKRHPFYSRIIGLMFWLGFIPF